MAFEKWATRLHFLLGLFLFFFFITYFSNFIIFNWRIITLQYCDDFCHTSVWISHSHTHVPSLLNLPPHPDPLGYINMYAWSRERWHWRSYLQGSKRCKQRMDFRHSEGSRGCDGVREEHWNTHIHFSAVAQLCPALCDPMDCSMPGLPIHHQPGEFTQTHVPWVDDAIQPSHPLSSPSSPAFNLFKHQDLFQWVTSSHEVVKVLEFQLQHQSSQWTPRTELL